MAHLRSKAILGYFPTPPRVAAAISRHLTSGTGGGRRAVRLLDPSAGEGLAAATLAHALSATAYGIELHPERAERARVCLAHVLTSDALGGVKVAQGAFSLLLLNPPYDDDAEAERLEHKFLMRYTDKLVAGGVLVYIVPQVRLAVSARFLASRYDDIAAWRFPDPDWSAFGQAVLLGTRRRGSAPDREVQSRIEGWSAGELPPLPDAPADPTTVRPVPPVSPGEIAFGAVVFDPATALAEVARRGVWTQPTVTGRFWPDEVSTIRPLMPLSSGHRGWLVVAGYINNTLLRDGDGRFALVKGRSYKESATRQEEGSKTVTVTDIWRSELTVLWLDTGEIERVGERAATGTGAAGDGDGAPAPTEHDDDERELPAAD